MQGNLTAADFEMFAQFGITAEMLTRAQVRRVTDVEARTEYRITRPGLMEGIAFPYLDPETGHRVSARLRRDHPDFDAHEKAHNKYICPFGDNRHLYFAPGACRLFKDASASAILVEAEKSVLAIAALAERVGRRILAIGTGGCWGWRGKCGIGSGPMGEREQVRGPLADLEKITWTGRRTIILFDSNCTTNPMVRAAREALAETLIERGSKVFFVDLPQGPGVNGPDDFIATRGGEALLTLSDDATEYQRRKCDADPHGHRQRFRTDKIDPVDRYLGAFPRRKGGRLRHGSTKWAS
jgi:Domain of unknown function (DUF3854)